MVSIQGSQAASGGTGTTINPGINLPVVTLSPTTTPTPVPTLNPGIGRNATTISPNHTLDNIPYGHLTDGFFTTSSLLYIIGPRNITVIEANTNKIVDVIYLDKYMLTDAAVSPDYKKLYVLYHEEVNPAKVGPGYDSDYGNFILTIDLDTKQIIEDTWYQDYPDYLTGSAYDLVLSPDGRYLYYGNNQMDRYGILFQYDTVLHKYTRGVITNEYYGSIKEKSSTIYDLSLTPDGKRLYFADAASGKLTFANLPDLSLNTWYRPGLDYFYPWTAAVSPEGKTGYLAGYYNQHSVLVTMNLPGMLAKEDDTVSTLEFSKTIDQIRLGPDPAEIFVMEPNDNQLVEFPLDMPAWTWKYKTGNRSESFVFSNNGSWIFVYSYGNMYVSVYDRFTREPIAGSPIIVGKDWGGFYPWSIGAKQQLVMGPDPAGSIFVNDSAYRAQRMLKLASMVQTPGTGHLPDVLDVNKSSGAGSSFYFDPALGMNLRFNASVSGPSGSPTIAPGYEFTWPANATIRPFPGEQIATPGPEDNQNKTQQDTGSASATPGRAGDTPKPEASVKATPGFGLVLGLTGLIGAALITLRKRL